MIGVEGVEQRSVADARAGEFGARAVDPRHVPDASARFNVIFFRKVIYV